MKTLATITLDNVKAVYSGAEGALWELIMGEQIHIGGVPNQLVRLAIAAFGLPQLEATQHNHCPGDDAHQHQGQKHGNQYAVALLKYQS